MPGTNLTTSDHETIRRWAEERQGAPATVRGTNRGDGTGILRIDFPGRAGEDQIEHISWEEWFSKFDEKHLALIYEDEKKSGEGSTFFKIIRREDATAA